MLSFLKQRTKAKMVKKTKDKRNGLITKESNLAELVTKYPQLAEVLFEDYGLHCVGCFASSFDTLEAGAQIHGMSDKETAAMVRRLNKLVKNFSGSKRENEP